MLRPQSYLMLKGFLSPAFWPKCTVFVYFRKAKFDNTNFSERKEKETNKKKDLKNWKEFFSFSQNIFWNTTEKWIMNSKRKRLKCVKKSKICLNLKAVKLVEEPTAMFIKPKEKIRKLKWYNFCVNFQDLFFWNWIFRSDSKEYALKQIEGAGLSMSACREIAVSFFSKFLFMIPKKNFL